MEDRTEKSPLTPAEEALARAGGEFAKAAWNNPLAKVARDPIPWWRAFFSIIFTGEA